MLRYRVCCERDMGATGCDRTADRARFAWWSAAFRLIAVLAACEGTSPPAAAQWHLTVPPPCREAAMCLDEARGVPVLFGGLSGDACRGETWELMGSDWQSCGGSGPSGRRGHAVAFDAARGEEGVTVQGSLLIVLLACIGITARWGLENIIEGANRWTATESVASAESGAMPVSMTSVASTMFRIAWSGMEPFKLSRTSAPR